MDNLINATSKVIKYPSYSGIDNIEVNLSYNTGEISAETPIFLYDQNKNICFYQDKTDKEGLLIIDNIDLKYKYFIISHDNKGLFNGVIADNIGGENVDD